MKKIVGILSIFLIMSYIYTGYTEDIDDITRKTEDFVHPNMYIDVNNIEAIKENVRYDQQPWKLAYDDVMKQANDSLNIPIQSVTFYGKIPPSRDIHDYWTDALYLSDGIVDSDSDRKDYRSATKLGTAVRSLGLAYALTGESKYADKAIQLINGWTVNPSTRMNPRFTNSQSKIEISMSIPSIFYGADLIWNYHGWTQSDKEAFKEWTTQITKSAKTWSARNNFENWRLVLISSASVITKDIDDRQYVFDRWTTIISGQMNLDGSLKYELERTNSLSYSMMALDAMVQTAEIARHQGVDLYNYKLPDGRGLESALDYHAPYATDPSTWKYQQISPYKGSTASLYELAYTFKKKTVYKNVIDKWERPMYEEIVMGPVTLTHGSV